MEMRQARLHEGAEDKRRAFLRRLHLHLSAWARRDLSSQERRVRQASEGSQLFAREIENGEGTSIQNILHRIGWNVVNPYFIVKMGTRRPSTHSELSNLISSFHLLAQSHQNSVEMTVPGGYSKSVGDHQDLSKKLIRFDGLQYPNLRASGISR
jgi:hypothetical protein